MGSESATLRVTMVMPCTKCGRRDQAVPDRPGIVHMESSALSCDGRVDGQYAICEGGQHVPIQPGAEYRALGRGATLREQYADFRFLDDDRR